MIVAKQRSCCSSPSSQEAMADAEAEAGPRTKALAAGEGHADGAVGVFQNMRLWL